MNQRIVAAPLSAAAFARFGQVLEAAGSPDRIINRGLCGRWHDLARLDFEAGRAGISFFRAEPRRLPPALVGELDADGTGKSIFRRQLCGAVADEIYACR